MFLACSLFLCVFITLSPTDARDFCESTYRIEYCYPDSYEESYCCGLYNDRCCYSTNVAALWWFWLVVILLMIFLAISIAICCRRRRHRQSTGFVIVRDGNYVPTTIATRNDETQVLAPEMVYPPYYGAAPPYQAYPGGYTNESGSTIGQPPPYNPSSNAPK